MKAALRCAGYVVAGIGAVAALFVVVGVVGYVMVVAADWTLTAFGLEQKWCGPIFCVYLTVLSGGVIGAAVCRDERR